MTLWRRAYDAVEIFVFASGIFSDPYLRWVLLASRQSLLLRRDASCRMIFSLGANMFVSGQLERLRSSLRCNFGFRSDFRELV
jgi:hypothetical protein